METLSLNQLDAFIKAGVAQKAAPPPKPPVPPPKPVQAQPVAPTPQPAAPRGLLADLFPELRVVDGSASIAPQSVVIARSCLKYGKFERKGDEYHLTTYKSTYVLTPTVAYWNGIRVHWWQQLYDAVRILRKEHPAIGRLDALHFDYAYRMACKGHFAPADLPPLMKPIPSD